MACKWCQPGSLPAHEWDGHPTGHATRRELPGLWLCCGSMPMEPAGPELTLERDMSPAAVQSIAFSQKGHSFVGGSCPGHHPKSQSLPQHRTDAGCWQGI